MKHTWKAALAVATVAVIGTAGAARADLTLDGQTGLFINPTAKVATKSSPEIQADYQRLSVDGYHFNTYGIGGAIGLADKFELSANYNRSSIEGEHGDTWRIGGKYQILQQADKGFDLAVGGNYEKIDFFGESDLTHYNAYVAGTKAFSTSTTRAPIEGTLGLRWDRFSDSGFSTSRASVYAGANVPLSSDGKFSLVGEFGTKIIDGGDNPYSIGLRYHPKGSGFSVGAGFGRPSLLNDEVDKSSIFAQVGYQFGK